MGNIIIYPKATMRSFTAGAVVALLASVAAAAPLDVVDTLRTAVDALNTDSHDVGQADAASAGALAGSNRYSMPDHADFKVADQFYLLVPSTRRGDRDSQSSYATASIYSEDGRTFETWKKSGSDEYMLSVRLSGREPWANTKFLGAHMSYPSDSFGNGQDSVRVVGHVDKRQAAYWAWVDHPTKSGKALQLSENRDSSAKFTESMYLAVGPFVDSWEEFVGVTVTKDANSAATVDIIN